MKTYKIKGIDKKLALIDPITRMLEWRLEGFKLEGVRGTVDVFVDGEFSYPDSVKKYMDDNQSVTDFDKFFKSEIEWAEKQVGKTLTCEDLIYRAFATQGTIAIK